MKRTWIKAAVIALVGVVALAVAVILLNNNDNAYYQQKRGTMSEGFGELKTIEWQGDTYREKPAVTTILLVGIDKANALENVNENEYRKGGQADFIMLIAIDKTDKKIHRLQIDRDTMTDIRIVGAFGTDAGTRVSQICLSHGYGATPEENAANTMWAVQNLMGDLEIDGYYMIDYGAMPALNDALGGVPVKIQFDMTSVNPDWTKGKTVVLHGKEAETFVRARMTIGQGTNEERMVRQAEFITNAITKMKQRVSNDLSFGEGLLDMISSLAFTNFSRGRLVNELNESYGFEYLPIDHPEGRYVEASADDAEGYLWGFMEFRMKENSVIEWMLDHLYTKKQK